MKVKFTMLMLAIAFSQGIAQLPTTFAPIGTRWEYNYFAYGQEQGKYVYESVADTLLRGIIHRVINATRKTKCDYATCDFITTKYQYFMTIRNDSLLSSTQTGYEFLFNFGLRVGDSVGIKFLNPNNKRAVVTRIADTLINNKSLKFWEIRQTCSATKYQLSKVYDLIGPTEDGFYEFYYDKCVSDPTIKFLCSVTSGNWTYSPRICTYSVATNEVNPLGLMMSPNPTSDIVNISLPNELNNTVYHTELYNSLGQIVHKKAVANNDTQLDIAGIPKGFYTVVLRNPADSKVVYSNKLIKL